jgi:hypothetical protein
MLEDASTPVAACAKYNISRVRLVHGLATHDLCSRPVSAAGQHPERLSVDPFSATVQRHAGSSSTSRTNNSCDIRSSQARIVGRS